MKIRPAHIEQAEASTDEECAQALIAYQEAFGTDRPAPALQTTRAWEAAERAGTPGNPFSIQATEWASTVWYGPEAVG